MKDERLRMDSLPQQGCIWNILLIGQVNSMINKYYLRICQADRPRNLVAQDRKPPLPLRGDLAHLSFALVVWATDWPARSQNNGLSNSFLLT